MTLTTDASTPNFSPTDSSVADRVEDAVQERPWLETVTKVGWIAKGVVYLLMGLTAVSVAQQERPGEEASPEGSLGRVVEQPGGRLLLGVLAVGLVLYALWRVLSVAVIRGHELTDWLERIGYGFSASFYAVLAWTAARATIRDVKPEDSNTIERLSRTLLESTAGRWLLGAIGLVTIGVGVYFIIEKAIRRSFTDDLRGVNGDGDDGLENGVVVAGVVGWLGRGIVTALVGFFVLRAAWRFDASEARGFDRALREVAGTQTGSILVWVSAIGLIVYGVYCLVSARYRTLEETA